MLQKLITRKLEEPSRHFGSSSEVESDLEIFVVPFTDGDSEAAIILYKFCEFLRKYVRVVRV